MSQGSHKEATLHTFNREQRRFLDLICADCGAQFLWSGCGHRPVGYKVSRGCHCLFYCFYDVTDWHTGFLHIAYAAKLPIVLGAIDGATKTIHLERTFYPTGNTEADMRAVKDYYLPFTGLKPENFTAE